jgi:predicted transcriptional regulator
MYKKKLEPLEILEKIKLSMKYDMGKTLNENRVLITEDARGKVSGYFNWCKTTNSVDMNKWERRLSETQITTIAKNINDGFENLNVFPADSLENILKKIPTRRDFCRLVFVYNKKYSKSLFDEIDGTITDANFTKISSGLYNAFKHNKPEESNKQSPAKSTIDKKTSTNTLRNTLGVSVLNQILNIKKIKNIRNLSNSVDFLNVANVDGKIRKMAVDEVIKLETNGRAKDTMTKYAEALRTDQARIVGDSTLTKYLNKMVSSLSSGGGDFISLFEDLVNVRKGTLGDLKRLQELRYSQTTTKLWDEIVKLPYKKINLWLRLAASLDKMKENGSPNLKFEQQPKKTLVDFSNNYPCLDFGPDNVVGKNEGSKYFIFQKDANGTKYKFYWPILDQGDKGMVFLSKSSGYYGSPSNNTFNTSKDTDTGFKWSCSGSGGIGGSKVIIENMSGNLVEGGWTLPKKKVDNQKDVNTGDVQQKRRSKYQLCSGTYKKGCKDNEGIISKVQGCLGLVADGKFGPKTESAINSKLNRNSFTKTDVDVLCKTEKITEPKPVEPKIVEPKPVEPEVVKITDLENI